LFKVPAEIQSMQDVWCNSVKKYAKKKCLEDLTYGEIDQTTRFIGSWMSGHGFKVLYIHSVNRVEWVLMDIAAMKFGIVTVALYDTLGKEALDHTLGLTGGKCIAESKAGATALMKAKPNSLKNITHMILFDEIEEALAKEISSCGI
jgi:long-chain acyl-CoA synthetase